MKEFTYRITAPAGIHAVPAAMLAQMGKNYRSYITISKGDRSADLTKLLKVMAMAVKKGDLVTVAAEGEDENVAIQELEMYFQGHL